MNHWQEVYLSSYGGKMPRSKAGKTEYELLEKVKGEVVVHFPDFTGINGFEPAHTEVYSVTANDCDMPNGRISVAALASNLILWLSRGYHVSTR